MQLILPGNEWAVDQSGIAEDFPPILNAVNELLKITNINLSPTWEEYGRSARTDNLILWLDDLPIEATSQSLGQRGFSPGGLRQEPAWLSINRGSIIHTGDGAWRYPHKGGMGYTMLLNMFGSALGLEQAHHAFPGVTSAYRSWPARPQPGAVHRHVGQLELPGLGDVSGKWGSMKSFGAFDIAALQKIYGANMTAATGNDVYTLPTVILVPTI